MGFLAAIAGELASNHGVVSQVAGRWEDQELGECVLFSSLANVRCRLMLKGCSVACVCLAIYSGDLCTPSHSFSQFNT